MTTKFENGEKHLFKQKFDSTWQLTVIKAKTIHDYTPPPPQDNYLSVRENNVWPFSAIFASVDFKLCLRACTYPPDPFLAIPWTTTQPPIRIPPGILSSAGLSYK